MFCPRPNPVHVGEANNEATRASRVFFPLGWSLCREVGVFCGRSELPVAPPRFPRPSRNGSPTSMLRFDTGQDRRKPSSRTPKHPSPAFETLAAATFSKSGCIERCRFFRLNRALRPSSTFRVVSSRYGSFAAAHANVLAQRSSRTDYEATFSTLWCSLSKSKRKERKRVQAKRSGFRG